MNAKINFNFKQLSGFTLVELLIGLVIGTLVVSFTGYSLIQMLRVENNKTNFSKQRTAFNMAADYLANRIRNSEVDNPDEVSLSSHVTGLSDDDLLISLNDETEIYYITEPADGSVWLGSKVIMRWIDGEGSTIFLDQVNTANVNEECGDGDALCTISLESYIEDEPEPYTVSFDVVPRI